MPQQGVLVLTAAGDADAMRCGMTICCERMEERPATTSMNASKASVLIAHGGIPNRVLIFSGIPEAFIGKSSLSFFMQLCTLCLSDNTYY